MIKRTIVTLFAIAGGVGASQAPELTQQYVQRMGGAVDELRTIVSNFDADAARNEADRDAALAELERSGQTASDQARRMRETIIRYDRLSEQYARLQNAAAFERTWMVLSSPDVQLMDATISDYRPAVPTTVEGAGHAAAGAGALGFLGAVFASPFRRRKRAA